MPKKLGIPVGLIGSGLTLPQAYMHGLFIDAFLSGKDESVNINEIAADTGLSEEAVEQCLFEMFDQGHLFCDRMPGDVSSYRVESVQVKLVSDQLKMNTNEAPKPTPNRYETGTETFKIGDVEFCAEVTPNDEGYSISITRTSDFAELVDGVAAATREDAWKWIDEWSIGDGPKAELKPDPIVWLDNARKNKIIQDDEIKLAPVSFWAVVGHCGVDRKFVEAENPPFIDIVTDDTDCELTVILGDANDLVIDGYEEPEEPSLFDDPAEAEAKPEPVQEETDTDFTVIASLDGVETEVRVLVIRNFLKEKEPMDKFVFTVTDVEYERLIASERVPFGQAIHEFARDLAQKAIDEAESA